MTEIGIQVEGSRGNPTGLWDKRDPAGWTDKDSK
jgi:hypothetical protein